MRADGKRIKNADPMYTVAAYIMDKRVDSMNMITIDIPVDPIKEYINEKRKDGINISHMAVILAAYVRVLNEFPELNRFVVNKKIYQRNEIAVGMVVLKAGQMDHGTMSKMYFKEDNNIFDVNNIINDYVNENRNEPDNNRTEKMIKFLLSVPGILPIGVGIFKFLDRHGLLPKSIIDASPFHMSLGITNLASIRTNHIYHHCYEFGTTSVFLAMGNTREVPRRKGSEIVFEKCMPCGITMDERIASGGYFALAFRKLKHYLRDPKSLEINPYKENKE
ncbi:MAG: 2-oxo acid dehydrogenase subunit E2 [Clostridia bacterium]|nr:2-oxo acid dehydrogenase subunit E2 [Clostridia bacterium]